MIGPKRIVIVRDFGMRSAERFHPDTVSLRGIASACRVQLHLSRPPQGRTFRRLRHVRLHDVRRTLGSWQAALGASLPVIGKSLGHRDTAATAIYSRLDLEPVRRSVDAATEAMVRASDG